ncbi:MAG: cytochrome ubiquinol oxidase subunit I [Moraxella osloensis]
MILIANGWMQTAGVSQLPNHAHGNDRFAAVLFNPEAQNKFFVHTVSAGYTVGATFVLAISAWYLLKKRDVEFAKRSFQVAAAFGFASICSTIVLGDESGYSIGLAQQTKMAAIEAMWETEPAPASFNLIADINQAEQKNNRAVQIPYVMGLIGTRSLDTPILVSMTSKSSMKNASSMVKKAVVLLDQLRSAPPGSTPNPVTVAEFEKVKKDLALGYCSKRYSPDVSKATPAMIKQATDATIPPIVPMFWSFRAMVGLGFLLLALFTISLWSSVKGNFIQKPWLLRWALLMLSPAPWLACCGIWLVCCRVWASTLDDLWHVANLFFNLQH